MGFVIVGITGQITVMGFAYVVGSRQTFSCSEWPAHQGPNQPILSVVFGSFFGLSIVRATPLGKQFSLFFKKPWYERTACVYYF